MGESEPDIFIFNLSYIFNNDVGQNRRAATEYENSEEVNAFLLTNYALDDCCNDDNKVYYNNAGKTQA